MFAKHLIKHHYFKSQMMMKVKNVIFLRFLDKKFIQFYKNLYLYNNVNFRKLKK